MDEEEIERLKAENEKLKQENQTLKKDPAVLNGRSVLMMLQEMLGGM